MHTKKQLEKIKNKLIRRVEQIIQCMDDENNFAPKETMLCDWCYLWEECMAKSKINPAKQAD